MSNVTLGVMMQDKLKVNKNSKFIFACFGCFANLNIMNLVRPCQVLYMIGGFSFAFNPFDFLGLKNKQKLTNLRLIFM